MPGIGNSDSACWPDRQVVARHWLRVGRFIIVAIRFHAAALHDSHWANCISLLLATGGMVGGSASSAARSAIPEAGLAEIAAGSVYIVLNIVFGQHAEISEVWRNTPSLGFGLRCAFHVPT